MAVKSDITVLLGILAIGAGALIIRKKAGKTTRQILNELFPGGFTASFAQLDILEAAGYPQGSAVYEEARWIAHDDVAATCTEGYIVGYSPDLGYYCVPSA